MGGSILDWNSLLSYLASLGSDPAKLNRDNVRPEKITFQATASAAVPPVLTQPGPQRVLETYWFIATRFTGFFQNPATNPVDIAKISFTISDPGEGRNAMFRNATNLAALVRADSGTGSLPMEVPYFFPPGATAQVVFTTDFVSGVWGGAFKTFGIVLEGWSVEMNFAKRCKIVPGS